MNKTTSQAKLSVVVNEVHGITYLLAGISVCTLVHDREGPFLSGIKLVDYSCKLVMACDVGLLIATTVCLESTDKLSLC